MFDINTKNVKKGRKIFYIFLVLGILFLLLFGSVFISNVVKLNSLDSTILSTKVEVKSHFNKKGGMMYLPVYYYEINGKSYRCDSNTSSSVNPGTKNKNVYYDSKDPSNCMTEHSKSNNYITLIFLIILLIVIFVSIINIIKINKRVKAILELNQKGKLIKNLPYRLEDTGMVVNNVPIQRPVVDYTLASGTMLTLYGDPRHDRKISDADGMVDLLIDENNPNNYYIDFEINRLTGNLPQDYYQSNHQSNPGYLSNQQLQDFNQPPTI